jgi:hypothetical protein
VFHQRIHQLHPFLTSRSLSSAHSLVGAAVTTRTITGLKSPGTFSMHPSRTPYRDRLVVGLVVLAVLTLVKLAGC